MLQERKQESVHICMETDYESSEVGENLKICFNNIDDAFQFCDILERIASEDV